MGRIAAADAALADRMDVSEDVDAARSRPTNSVNVIDGSGFFAAADVVGSDDNAADNNAEVNALGE